MTTATVAELAESQQTLIDARLDTIDRMLLGHVSRADRITIVSEVEAQIQELLGAKVGDEASREDVIDALRRLDPPEAYLPDSAERNSSQHRVGRFSSQQPMRQRNVGRVGWIGGVLGLFSFGWILLWGLIVVLAQGATATVFLVGLMTMIPPLGFAIGAAALVCSIRGRSQGVLPILGIGFGAISLQFWLLLAGYLLIA